MFRDLFEPLAQAVEQLPFKQRVAGSSPARLILGAALTPTGGSIVSLSSSLAQDTGLSRR